jgi:hypothetical protein
MGTGEMPLALLRDATRNSVMKSVTAPAIFIYLICIPRVKKFPLKLCVRKAFLFVGTWEMMEGTLSISLVLRRQALVKYLIHIEHIHVK